MSSPLEQRLDTVERKVATLADGVANASPRVKDWRVTFGLSKDHPEFMEVIWLGQEYRRRPALAGRARS